jgi:hypothetical protein
MRAFPIVILSFEEAKEELLEWRTQTLLNDRNYLKESLKDGTIAGLGNFNSISHKEVCDQYEDLNLAEKYGIQYKAGAVYISQIGTGSGMIMVWQWKHLSEEEQEKVKHLFGDIQLNNAQESTVPEVANKGMGEVDLNFGVT